MIGQRENDRQIIYGKFWKNPTYFADFHCEGMSLHLGIRIQDKYIEDRQIRNCSVDEDYFSITTFYALLPQISIQHYQIIKQEYRRASISLTSPFSIYSYVNNYDIHHDLYISSHQLQQCITVKVRRYYFYHDSIPSQLQTPGS